MSARNGSYLRRGNGLNEVGGPAVSRLAVTGEVAPVKLPYIAVDICAPTSSIHALQLKTELSLGNVVDERICQSDASGNDIANLPVGVVLANFVGDFCRQENNTRQGTSGYTADSEAVSGENLPLPS